MWKIEKETEQQHWKVCNPFYKDSLDGVKGTLPIDDIDHVLIEAYQRGKSGGGVHGS